MCREPQLNSPRVWDNGVVPLRQDLVKDNAHRFLKVLGDLSALVIDPVYDLHGDPESLASMCLFHQFLDQLDALEDNALARACDVWE